MQASPLSGWEEELERWLAPFVAGLRCEEQRRWAAVYLKGLILPGERKSVGGAGGAQRRPAVASFSVDLALVDRAA